jgi:nitrogen-specific signal transduction histidine kinase
MLGQQNHTYPASLEKILVQERWITIGRLISSFVHEINNPLQAIRGALALALDDIENPRELREYITISQQEIEHITALLNQVRLIYRAHSEEPELFPLTVIFRDAFDLTREESMRQKVRILNHLPADSPVVEGNYNHIYLVILRTILVFIDAIGAAGGGELAISAEDTSSLLVITFMTHTLIMAQETAPGSPSANNNLMPFDLASTSELVKANGGVMELQLGENQIAVRICLSQVA